MNRFRVGIAGYGVVGKRRERAVAKNSHLQLVAVCDRAFDSNGTREDGVKFFHSFKDLISEPLDILVVCMTNDVAAEAVIAGLERKLHVFCEKPPGRNLDDIARVIVAERKVPGIRLKYGFNHRYHHSIVESRALAGSGEFGKLISLRGVYGKSSIITFNQSDWRTKRSIAGGGVLLDQGIHMVDLMRLFAGDFSAVHSFVDNNYWNFDVEDNAYALMKTSAGVVAMLHSSATQWRHRFSLDLQFEKGAIVLGGILSGSKSYGAETMTVVWSNPEQDAGDPREVTTRYNTDPSWEAEINDFVDCIVCNRSVEHGSSLDAYKTMELVYKIYCSDNDWKTRYNIIDKPSFDFKL